MAQASATNRMSALLLANKPRLRMLALAITIAAAAFLLWRSNEQPVTSYSDAKQLRGESEPDGFVVNADYTSYDASGNRDIVFTSPRIEQFEKDGLATMKAPTAELFSTNGDGPWIVNADTGKLRQGDDLLELRGNVRVVRLIGEREATLTTETLTLDNEQRIAFTNDPVKITDSTGVTRSKGMKAWMDERVVELKSQVEGHYETIR